jgi:hypothetical protein
VAPASSTSDIAPAAVTVDPAGLAALGLDDQRDGEFGQDVTRDRPGRQNRRCVGGGVRARLATRAGRQRSSPIHRAL